MSVPKSVDDYLAQFDGEVLARLLLCQKLVRQLVPTAEEGVMYGILGYKLGGNPLVYFGGFKNHIGLYATPNGHDAFKKEFAKYTQGKGSVQFPNDQTLPIDLITRVVEYRVEQLAG